MVNKQMYSLLFFDFDKEKIDEYERIIGKKDNIDIEYLHIDVRDLIKEHNIDVIVSPANSLGFMDGGIDIYYMQMFPGIQERVQSRIKSFDVTTFLGRYVLNVGSAAFVATNDETCPLLACVPTMFLPEDIRNTDNVYWATMGLLTLLQTYKSNKIKKIAIPCMGTGVGKLTAADSAIQVNKAFNDFAFSEKAGHAIQVKGVLENTPYAYVLEKPACEQPNTYANTELTGDLNNFLQKV